MGLGLGLGSDGTYVLPGVCAALAQVCVLPSVVLVLCGEVLFRCAPVDIHYDAELVVRGGARCSAQVVENGTFGPHASRHGDAGAARGRQSRTALLPSLLHLRCARRRTLRSNR